MDSCPSIRMMKWIIENMVVPILHSLVENQIHRLWPYIADLVSASKMESEEILRKMLKQVSAHSKSIDDQIATVTGSLQEKVEELSEVHVQTDVVKTENKEMQMLLDEAQNLVVTVPKLKELMAELGKHEEVCKAKLVELNEQKVFHGVAVGFQPIVEEQSKSCGGETVKALGAFTDTKDPALSASIDFSSRRTPLQVSLFMGVTGVWTVTGWWV